MRLSMGQQMQMSQKQVLAPRMIQSMEILQLPILALQERIEQEMEENPCLDQADANISDSVEINTDAESPSEDQHPDAPEESERELVVDEDHSEEDFERLLNMTDNFPDQFEDRPRLSRGEIDEAGDRKLDAMANMVARPQSLQDYLHDQLSWFELNEDLRAMADRIIYSLDTNGYLSMPLEDLALTTLTDTDTRTAQIELAEQALGLVQKLDPPGVGARDTRECLLLQLTPGMPYYEELRTLINDHLDDLAHNRLPQIEKKTGYSIELIQTVWECLRKLKAKPGADFSDTFVPNVTPDVFIDPDENGGYQVRLEDSQIPSLFISPYYRRLLQDPATTPETRDYIKRKVNSAQWLIESIEQRRSTLTKVSQAIVDHQLAFLDQGPEAIEPLKMQQIADKVGVHVTTVSRAVDDKWIQTRRGIFPLRRFFVGGTVSADGEEVAWDAVRIKLQEVVDHEDKTKPFSDEELVNQLATHGITVARRTVTKYRKAMNIPSSRQRRDWSKKNGSE